MPFRERGEWECRDVWSAAFLHCMGVPFLRAVPIDARRCCFIFSNDGDKAHDLTMEWRERVNATVNGPALAESYRAMVTASKDAIYREDSYDRRYAA